MNIRLAEETDKNALYKLWRECFGDSDSTIDMFFKNSFDKQNTVVCCDGEALVSMLFLLPEKLKINKSVFDAYYIYAAATDNDYRRRGIMSNMLSFSTDICIKRNIPFLFLVPANEPLFRFYENNGFVTAIRQKQINISNAAVNKLTQNALPQEPKADEKSNYLSRDNAVRLNDCVLWRKKELKLYYDYSGCELSVVSDENGYLSYIPEKENTVVTEFLPVTDKMTALMKSLSYVKSESFTLNLQMTVPLVSDCQKIVDIGMIKQVSGDRIDLSKLSIYIGFTLN